MQNHPWIIIIIEVAKMDEKQLVCSSCHKRLTNMQGAAKFMCPNCGKAEIIRCRHCREIAATYTCPECGFTGPN